jgi:hypothetical protein
MAMPGLAEGIAREHVARRVNGLIRGLGDDHAFAGGEAVGLDHDGCAGFFDIRLGRGELGEVAVGCGRDVVTCEKILGEGLGAFELRGVFRGPEYTQTRGAESIDHAEYQWRLGADHGEIDPVLLREVQQAVYVISCDRDIFAFGFVRAAGVAGSDEHFYRPGRLRDFPGQRVFASATADDKNFHFSLSAK